VADAPAIQDPATRDPAKQKTACQVCGAFGRRLYIRHRTAKQAGLERSEWELFECMACGLVYLDPAPSRAEIAFFYFDPYAHATTSYFAKSKAKLKRSATRVRMLLRFLPGGAAGKSFLDIGCNGGFMVEAARLAGFRGVGIDPDRNAVSYAEAHFPENEFLHGLLEDDILGGRQFDAIYCSEVIEHAADANRFMTALVAALRPGGLLYLTTPDVSHWRRPRDITRWDAFCPPAHCLYFNPENLRALLARHGLEVIHRRWAFKPGIKLLARKAA
jgi:2-polyprenyl-3-methyl-5-hydroxy-6-metoxy-1,4-benzoquinol methylase